MSNSSASEGEEMKVTGGFGREVDAATLKADANMASAGEDEEPEESKNEGTSLTEKMANLDLEDSEPKKPVKKKVTKKPKQAAKNEESKGPTTSSRARLQAFLS